MVSNIAIQTYRFAGIHRGCDTKRRLRHATLYQDSYSFRLPRRLTQWPSSPNINIPLADCLEKLQIATPAYAR